MLFDLIVFAFVLAGLWILGTLCMIKYIMSKRFIYKTKKYMANIQEIVCEEIQEIYLPEEES